MERYYELGFKHTVCQSVAVIILIDIQILSLFWSQSFSHKAWESPQVGV